MKRNNNKYRNNNSNNQIYSLNYKFDSNSPAGKYNGTALDLIKRYNELAKDAQSDNDYVSAEVYRQYAEHYRKIVTEINEKKNQNRQQAVSVTETSTDNSVETPKETSENNINNENTVINEQTDTIQVEKKSFTIVEIPHSEAETVSETVVANDENVHKPKRVYRRRQQNVAE